MISLITVTFFGFLLGMRHATDADHVIAVTTIVSRFPNMRRAAWTGLYWGLGHSLTILFVGSGVILLGVMIPARIELGLELAVSAMLIALGLASLASFFQSNPESRHSAESTARQTTQTADESDARNVGREASSARILPEELHPHPTQHKSRLLVWTDRILGPFRLFQKMRPLVVGIVHGMAGSAAIALLILTTIPHPGWGIAYLVFFGAGTIAGMMLFTIGIASASVFLETKYRGSFRWFRLSAGLLSLAFGVVLGFRLLFLEEALFSIS